MKRFILAVLALACLYSPVSAKEVTGLCDNSACLEEHVISVKNDMLYDPSTFAPQQYAQAATSTQTTTQTPTTPASVTTVVKGGTIAADVLEWFKVIFVPILGAIAAGIAYRIMVWFGLKVDDSNKAALQAIIVNGLNQAAAKAETSLKGNAALNIDVKNQVIADAVAYTQDHAKDTIKALGLDKDDAKAVEAIRARIQTAIVDPLTPTNPALDKIINKAA